MFGDRPGDYGDPEAYRNSETQATTGRYRLWEGFSGWDRGGTTPIEEVPESRRGFPYTRVRNPGNITTDFNGNPRLVDDLSGRRLCVVGLGPIGTAAAGALALNYFAFYLVGLSISVVDRDYVSRRFPV